MGTIPVMIPMVALAREGGQPEADTVRSEIELLTSVGTLGLRALSPCFSHLQIYDGILGVCLQHALSLESMGHIHSSLPLMVFWEDFFLFLVAFWVFGWTFYKEQGFHIMSITTLLGIYPA
jgi:hypothetical protein